MEKIVVCLENGNTQTTFNWRAGGLHGYSENAGDIVAAKARWRLSWFEVSAKKSQGAHPIAYEQGYVAVTVADSEDMSPQIKLMLCSTERRDGKSSNL